VNDEDLRLCLVIMATAGLTFKHGVFDSAEPWRIADRIMDARKEVDEEPEVGIVAVKKRRTKNV